MWEYGPRYSNNRYRAFLTKGKRHEKESSGSLEAFFFFIYIDRFGM